MNNKNIAGLIKKNKLCNNIKITCDILVLFLL